MCGRFTSLLTPELLAVIFEIFNIPLLQPQYNVAPTLQVPVVRNTGDRNELVNMRWGLIPHWSKDAKIGASLINARCETVAEKPSFRSAIRSRRCIIPASGFYEWQHAGTKKLPYYITMNDQSLMAMAGIWEGWKTPEGELAESFSVLTTEANSAVAPLHDRMPVILGQDDYSLWLDPEMREPGELVKLYTPLPADRLTMYRVSERMNSSLFTGPECIERC